MKQQNGIPSNCVLEQYWDVAQEKASSAITSLDAIGKRILDLNDHLESLTTQLEFLNEKVVGAAVSGHSSVGKIMMVQLAALLSGGFILGSLLLVDRVKHSGASVDVSGSGIHIDGGKGGTP